MFVVASIVHSRSRSVPILQEKSRSLYYGGNFDVCTGSATYQVRILGTEVAGTPDERRCLVMERAKGVPSINPAVRTPGAVLLVGPDLHRRQLHPEGGSAAGGGPAWSGPSRARYEPERSRSRGRGELMDTSLLHNSLANFSHRKCVFLANCLRGFS